MFLANVAAFTLIVIGAVMMAIGIHGEFKNDDVAILSVGYLLMLLGIVHLGDPTHN